MRRKKQATVDASIDNLLHTLKSSKKTDLSNKIGSGIAHKTENAESLLEMRSDFVEEEPVKHTNQFSEIKEEQNLNNSSLLQRSADSRDEIGGFLTEREHNNTSPPQATIFLSKETTLIEIKTPPKPIPTQILEELPEVKKEQKLELTKSEVKIAEQTDDTNSEINKPVI